jgi:hypothetical protein
MLTSADEPWGELVEATMQFIESPSGVLRKTAFQVITGVPTLFVAINNTASIAQMFNRGATDAELGVRVAALKAAIYYLMATTAATRDQMAGLVPLLLNIIPPIMAQSDKEDMAAECLGYFIELAQESPKLFKAVLPNLVAFMAQQMQNTELEDATRQICLELLLTLTEHAPGMMRKHPNFAQTVIPITLDWMAELEDEQDWYTSENVLSCLVLTAADGRRCKRL